MPSSPKARLRRFGRRSTHDGPAPADRGGSNPHPTGGAGAGETGFCEVLRGGQRMRVRSKDQVELQRGDVVTMAPGGGYGDPARRPASMLEDDLADGLVTAARAGAAA